MSEHRRRVVFIAVATLSPLVLVRVPLLNGLTYEYAVVVALLLFAVAVVAGSRAAIPLAQPYPLRFKLLVATPRERLGGALEPLMGDLIAAALAAAIIPSWLGARAGCAWESGLPIYLFVVLPVCPLGLALGAMARTWAPSSRRRRAAIVACFVVLSALVTVYEVVAGPRAVFHNLMIGVVSNTAYLGLDESIRIEGHDLLHRVATLWTSLLLLAIACTRAARDGRLHADAEADATTAARGRLLLDYERRVARRRAIALAAILLAMIAIGDPFGFGSGRRSLERRLSGRYETAHLELRFRPGSRVDRLREGIGADCEWSYHTLCARLGLDPEAVARTTVYVYEDDAEQRRLTGADGYLFAKPWLGEFHTRLDRTDELVAFRHELVHVLAAEFGLPVARVSARYGLIEGLAEGVAGDFAERPWRHRAVVAALEVGLLPRAADLLANLGFANLDASTSYLATASFCGFLLRRSGPELLRRVYALGDFERVYGRTIDQLDDEWRGWLATIEVDRRDRAIATRAFDREASPPFFRRTCARLGLRVVARRVDPVDEATALAQELSTLDTRAAVGPQLMRDNALAWLAYRSAAAGNVDGAVDALHRRERLGIAPPVVSAGLRALDAAPELGDVIVTLLTGHPRQPRTDAVAASLALYRLTVEPNLRSTQELVAAIEVVGGCASGLESLEARSLLRAARVLRRRGEGDAVARALATASSIAPSGSDVELDLREELARERLAVP